MQIDFSVPAPLKIQAYSILKKAIIRGIFADHDAITEKLVQEKFNISRTPFREAIQILESEGWVYTLPYKGTYVKPITLKDLEELFELRQIIEPGIIDCLMDNSREISIKPLEKILDKMMIDEGLQSDFDFMSLDRDFHHMFYALTNNKRLISVADQISDIMLRVGIRILNRHERREEVIREHRLIITGFQDGTAKNHLRKHLETTKDYYCQLYAGAGTSD